MAKRCLQCTSKVMHVEVVFLDGSQHRLFFRLAGLCPLWSGEKHHGAVQTVYQASECSGWAVAGIG